MKRFKDAEVLQSFATAELCSAIDDLLGKGKWTRPRPWGGFLVNLPKSEEDGPWYIPRGDWHVDYHYTHDPEPLFGLRVSSFLSNIKRQGGGTLVVSGSHRVVGDYVKTLSPAERNAGYAKVRDRMHNSLPWFRRLTKGNERAPNRIPMLGRGGTSRECRSARRRAMRQGGRHRADAFLGGSRQLTDSRQQTAIHVGEEYKLGRHVSRGLTQ